CAATLTGRPSRAGSGPVAPAPRSARGRVHAAAWTGSAPPFQQVTPQQVTVTHEEQLAGRTSTYVRGGRERVSLRWEYPSLLLVDRGSNRTGDFSRGCSTGSHRARNHEATLDRIEYLGTLVAGTDARER